jgi:hypothetical protein
LPARRRTAQVSRIHKLVSVSRGAHSRGVLKSLAARDVELLRQAIETIRLDPAGRPGHGSPPSQPPQLSPQLSQEELQDTGTDGQTLQNQIVRRGSQAVRQWFAKPSYVGSNPIHASATRLLNEQRGPRVESNVSIAFPLLGDERSRRSGARPGRPWRALFSGAESGLRPALCLCRRFLAVSTSARTAGSTDELRLLFPICRNLKAHRSTRTTSAARWHYTRPRRPQFGGWRRSARLRSCSTASILTGLVKCTSKPASMASLRSSGWP